MLNQQATEFVREGDPLSASKLNAAIAAALPQLLVPGAFQSGSLFLVRKPRRGGGTPVAAPAIVWGICTAAFDAATGLGADNAGTGSFAIISQPDGGHALHGDDDEHSGLNGLESPIPEGTIGEVRSSNGTDTPWFVPLSC